MVRFFIKHGIRWYSYFPIVSVSGVPLPYTIVRQPRFFTTVVNETYNLLKGSSLSHNQRGINWCLLFTFRYRKHRFVVNLFYLMDHDNLLRRSQLGLSLWAVSPTTSSSNGAGNVKEYGIQRIGWGPPSYLWQSLFPYPFLLLDRWTNL